MTIIVTCRHCGHQYETDRQAILSGDWRRCPICTAAQRAHKRRKPRAVGERKHE
jgi:hypothetical protein